MKAILVIGFLLFVSSCANNVLVRKSTCEDISGDIAKCEEVE